MTIRFRGEFHGMPSINQFARTSGLGLRILGASSTSKSYTMCWIRATSEPHPSATIFTLTHKCGAHIAVNQTKRYEHDSQEDVKRGGVSLKS